MSLTILRAWRYTCPSQLNLWLRGCCSTLQVWYRNLRSSLSCLTNRISERRCWVANAVVDFNLHLNQISHAKWEWRCSEDVHRHCASHVGEDEWIWAITIGQSLIVRSRRAPELDSVLRNHDSSFITCVWPSDDDIWVNECSRGRIQLSRWQTCPDRDCGREPTKALLISRSVVECVELAWDEASEVFIQDDVEPIKRRWCCVLKKLIIQTFRTEVPEDFIVGNGVLTSSISTERNPL